MASNLLRVSALALLAIVAFMTLVWVISVWVTNARGGWQLTRFKANPANQGKLFDAGLWKYTRHPNYFGDALQWRAFYLIAPAAGGWWSIFSPLLMTTLLVHVSGVSLLKKSLAQSRPGYREYLATTSAFVPWKKNKPPGGASRNLREACVCEFFY